MKEKVELVHLPTYTRTLQSVPAEHAKDAIIKLIEAIGFEKAYKTLKQEGLQLQVGVHQKYITQKLAIIPKMNPVFILENTNLNNKNRYRKELVFFDIGFGNEQLLLNAVLKTLPKKYTNVPRTENLKSVGEFMYQRVNEYISAKNKGNEDLYSRKSLKDAEKMEAQKELIKRQETVADVLNNWNGYYFETDVTYWRSKDGMLDTTQIYIHHKISEYGRVNIHFILMGSTLDEIQFYYQVIYRDNGKSTKITLTAEQESQLNNLFKRHFLSKPDKFDDFANRFGERMYKQYRDRGLDKEYPNLNKQFYINQANTAKYKIVDDIDNVDYSKLYR